MLSNPERWLKKYEEYYHEMLTTPDQAEFQHFANPRINEWGIEYLMSGICKTPIVGRIIAADRTRGTYTVLTPDGTQRNWENAWFTHVPECMIRTLLGELYERQ